MSEMIDREQLGRHDFFGRHSPLLRTRSAGSFSLGVFQWKKRVRGTGLKRGVVKVRVFGLTLNPDPAYAKAAEICDALDAGTYAGPKTVKTWPRKYPVAD